MFPRISDLLNYLFGTNLDIPVQSYGLMMAFAFISGGIILLFELQRKEKNGEIPCQEKRELKGAPATIQELILSALFGFILGWKGIGIFLNYDLFSLDPQAFLMSTNGSLVGGVLLAGIIAGVTYYKKHRLRLEKPLCEEVTIHPYQLTGNIILVAAVFGIAGAKLFDTIEHLDDFFRDPFGTLFSFSGLSFYGGFIIAAIAVVWYCSKHKIRFPHIADAIAPALILAYAIGRLGCQLAGDGCWGVINPDPMPEWLSFLPNWVWSFQYPHNVIDEGMLIPGCQGEHCHILGQPVYPTPFYETLMGLSIFGILWGVRKHLKIPGYLFSIYLILNGIERFLIEKIRINIPYDFLGMEVTQAEIIAIGLIIIGIVGFWFFKWLDKRANNQQETA